jgi:ribosomal protein L7/L12
MKAMHKLATAGQSVLDALGDLRIKSESMHEDSKSNEPSIDLGDQIQKLVSLHDAGALTDSEFESAKANVIGAITKEPVQNPPSNETFPELQSERELDVILLSAPRSQIEIIKVVREYSNWKLAHAKSLVDNPPSIVATGLNALLAEELKRRLESFGAQVELR